ncbi:MAG: enoyl-CoA hydratase/isomerase family protein [Chloroflexi bacterium]|nr:enoyl-CoA hydratase/isomerase family protein [Chloroflexota bacterium]
MDYENILYEKKDKVAKITLNRPEKLNALSQDLLAEFRHVLDTIDDSEDVTVVLITGAGGRAFSTGFDLGKATRRSDDEWWRRVKLNFDSLMRVWDLRQPVIAAVNGYAVAAGCNLAFICDMCVAADNAMFGEPEIRHFALAPFMLFPWVTGFNKKLHELYYTGDSIDALEAERFGLVNKVVPLDKLQEEAEALAQRVAMVHSFPLQLTKRSIKKSYEIMGFKDAQDYHRSLDTYLLSAQLPEKDAIMNVLYSQGLRAFLEVRDGPFAKR